MNEPYDNETLLISPGYAQRTGMPYFPPRDVMEEYLRFSREHDGHVLMPSRGYGIRRNETAERVILWSPKTDFMTIAEIAATGSPYTPRSWDAKDRYQAPRPWNMMVARWWLALDDMRELPPDGFTPSLYEVVGQKGRVEPLESVLAGTHMGVLRIRPA